jgi:methionine aminopeptidase type I
VIRLKTKSEVDVIRRACQINSSVHEEVKKAIVPGITTKELDAIAETRIRELGGRSSFREEYNFPGNICISVNDEIGHGVPSERILKSGDVVKVDIGVEYHGYHSDCAKTHLIGSGSREKRHLIRATEQALRDGLAVAKPGRHLSDVSDAIGRCVSRAGLTIVKKAHGHGIGTSLHEDPQVPNYGPPGHGPRLREGMVLAIEPVVVTGNPSTRLRADGWTEVSVDGSIGAHFEHTVYITGSGLEVLTAGQQAAASPSASLARFGLNWRQKKDSDNPGILYLAKAEMDAILLEAWGRPVQPDEVLRTPASSTFVLTNGQAEVKGFCVFSYRRPYLHLNTIVLDSSLHGSGVASEVMSLIRDEAEQAGMSGIELWVQTNNHRAIRFYQKLGFAVTGQPYFRTLAMRKPL